MENILQLKCVDSNEYIEFEYDSEMNNIIISSKLPKSIFAYRAFSALKYIFKPNFRKIYNEFVIDSNNINELLMLCDKINIEHSYIGDPQLRIQCCCNLHEHHISVSYDQIDNVTYNYFLLNRKSLPTRILNGIKYIFRPNNEIYFYDEVILDSMGVENYVKLLNLVRYNYGATTPLDLNTKRIVTIPIRHFYD